MRKLMMATTALVMAAGMAQAGPPTQYALEPHCLWIMEEGTNWYVKEDGGCMPRHSKQDNDGRVDPITVAAPEGGGSEDDEDTGPVDEDDEDTGPVDEDDEDTGPVDEDDEDDEGHGGPCEGNCGNGQGHGGGNGTDNEGHGSD